MPTVRYTVMDGEIVSENRNGTIRDYVPDPLGSTIALLDQNQNITDTFSYWPYGEERTRTGTTPTPFKYFGCAGWYTATSRLFVNPVYLPRYAAWLNVLFADQVAPGHGKAGDERKDLAWFLKRCKKYKRLKTDLETRVKESACASAIRKHCGADYSTIIKEVRFEVKEECGVRGPLLGMPLPGVKCLPGGKPEYICIPSWICDQVGKRTEKGEMRVIPLYGDTGYSEWDQALPCFILWELGNWCQCKSGKLKNYDPNTGKGEEAARDILHACGCRNESSYPPPSCLRP
ncbi:MAG: hypothetical protein HND42_05735 [Armatimonadetes bacterium]|nr:hypothetical protein [Armatimonadota bacterium]MCE7901031.1 hypothetical protein [Armatimonadetes bacterium ATM1]NOG92729.1 hypothetical protein [Armatimonadota bacterium]